MLLIGGDFNTSLAPHPPNVGHGVLKNAAADLEQERQLLNEFFCRHRLSVLNSWGRKQATYEHPTGNTQIDFLVVRQQVSDSCAKQAGGQWSRCVETSRAFALERKLAGRVEAMERDTRQ